MDAEKSNRITALVHYQEYIDSGSALLDGGWYKDAKVVEVDKLTDLNKMFEGKLITKIDVLKTQC